MDLEGKNGFKMHELGKINVLIGKNGCGKSTALKLLEQKLISDNSIGKIQYITPERGGELKYDSGVENNLSRDASYLIGSRRKNQLRQFREQSYAQFRKLELLALREIEKDLEVRGEFSHTFDSYIDRINGLLDNIEIKRAENGFDIFIKSTDETIDPSNISSGESELISLAIECLVFEKELHKDKLNILLFDEPDVHLHPDLQWRLAAFIESITHNYNTLVIIATHSTSFIAGISDYRNSSVCFMNIGQKELVFKPVSEKIKKMLPIFGAHPLSNIFNKLPILLVDGEDDERIWRQALRTSEGSLLLTPCSVDGVGNLSSFEDDLLLIINSVYDNPVAYSLRDGDGITGNIENTPPLKRFRLSCYSAENLILTDNVLDFLKLTWSDIEQGIEDWLVKNPNHAHYSEMLGFKKNGFNRKESNVKIIRNDLMGIMGIDKPWEVVVGQVLGRLQRTAENRENDIRDYLGYDLFNELWKNEN